MLCARVVRGAASRAKLVRPAAASACRPARSNGLSMPTSAAPLFISAQLVGARRAHLEHQIGAERAGAVGDLGAGRGVGGVGDARGDAGARLDPDRVALRLQLLRRLRRRRRRASRRPPSRAAPRSACSCLLACPVIARAYTNRPCRGTDAHAIDSIADAERWKPNVTVAAIVEPPRDGAARIPAGRGRDAPRGCASTTRPATSTPASRRSRRWCARRSRRRRARSRRAACVGVYLSRLAPAGERRRRDLPALRLRRPRRRAPTRRAASTAASSARSG